MHIRCPHCQHPIDLVNDIPLKDIECPSCGSSFSLVSDDTSATRIGDSQTIGHFNLVEHIGVGRFGSVWKAQDTELDRTVAVKIPRSNQLSAEESEAFFREARAAAQLKHPHIVPVHEVGRENETIYIVSDFIQGANLKEWISAHALGFKEAAELCTKLALAIHHAHQSGVVHRDLKPSNIMMDFDGEPHIMDFGLAKRESGEITMTMDGQILGTPAYMSPEQAGGESHRLDGRADVYSLGVILYELLTGELPFRGEKRMLIVQILNEEPPAPRKLNSRVPRDLETICLKCLEKEPQKRYQTAQKLADDLSRWLEGNPILARPVGRIERTWRWSRRHPGATVAVAAVTAAALILAVAVGVVSGKNRELKASNESERRAKDEAEENFQKAHKVVDEFFTEVSESRELLKGTPGTQQLRKRLLERAQKYYEDFIRRRAGDEKLQAELAAAHFKLANIASETGEKPKALATYKKALEIYQRLARENPTVPKYQRDLATSYNNIGILHSDTGKLDEALAALEKSLEIRERLVRENPDVTEYQNDVATSYNNIGALHMQTDKLDEALAAHEKSLEILEWLVRENPASTEYQSDLARSHYNMGLIYQTTGQPDEALASSRKALEIREKLTEENPMVSEYLNDLAASHNDLGIIYQTTCQPDEALASHRKAIEIREKLAKENPKVPVYRNNLAASYNNIGVLYTDTGQPDDALASYRKAIEIREKLVKENPTVPAYRSDLAVSHYNMGIIYQTTTSQRDEALASYRKALQFQEKLAEENPKVTAYRSDLAASHNSIGVLYADAGQPDKALASYRKVLEIREKLAEENPQSIEIAIDLGESYVNIANVALSQKDYETATTYYNSGVKTLSRAVTRNPRHPAARRYLLTAYWGRATLMQNLKRFDDAVADWGKAIEYSTGRMKVRLQIYRAAAVAKAKLQKTKKKSKSKKQTGVEKKKSDRNRDVPLVAPRPKHIGTKEKV